MKRVLFFLALLPLACAAPDRDPCADVASSLAKCGVPVSQDLACADPNATQAIAQRLDAAGCAGLDADGTGTLDPRVCDLGGFSCPPPPTPDPSGAAPKNLLVFVSGIDASPTFDWNARILATLRGHGIDARHASLSPWASKEDRAADLWSAVAAAGARVNLVCYAVGGVDCRFLASPRGLFADDPGAYARVHDAIASVTTIATPHLGTRVADEALSALESGTASEILAAIAGTTAAPDTAALAKTLDALTVESMADFDARVPDADGIYYQSFAGVSRVLGKSTNAAEKKAEDACGATFFRHAGTNDAMNELLWATAPFAGAPSDGMIEVASAKHGVFRGCIPADHYDVIGQIGHVTRDANTGFDDVRFYEWLAGDLAARGL